MATKALATWVTNLNPSTLPDSVRKAAARSLYNYIGCTLGGATHPAVSKAHGALSPFFGPKQATLYGSLGGTRTDALHAALLNGIASHVHDYDDTHLATIIHPTGPVASALLAYAEYVAATGGKPLTGPELLTALAAGIEASCKLGLAVYPTHYDVGWHITGTTGSLGAAVAVGRAMRLAPGPLAHAIGLAAVQVVGLREMFGSDTKSFHPGRAAQAGLTAALLAQKGYTSSEQGLEAPRGWANVVVSGGTPCLDAKLAELGRGAWETERNAFKPFPCGIVCHPAIDAANQLHAELGEAARTGKIRAVHAKVHPLVIELTSKRTPKDGLEAKFSVFHAIAVGLLTGKATPSQYLDEVVTDPQVVAVRDRVEAEIGEGLEADAAVLRVELEDGRVWTKEITHAVGSLEAPMSDAQLEEKFLDQAGLVVGQEKARKASELAWKIGEAEDVVKVLRAL